MKRDTTFLNLFRGIAAGWVVLAHSVVWGGGVLPEMIEPKKAVDLFMVLSGFLMMLTMSRVEIGWPSIRDFYLRRFFRIAPAYYVALLVMAALWPWVADGFTGLQTLDPKWATMPSYWPQSSELGLANVAFHMTFLFGLSPSYSFSTGLPDWSLSLEMQFYAVFPLLLIWCRRYRFGIVAMAIGLGCELFTRQYSIGVEHGVLAAFDEPSLLPFKLSMFLVGMLIYEAGAARRAHLLGVAALLLAISCRWYGINAVLLFGLIASIASLWWFGEPKTLRPVFRSRIVEFLSDTSYSVYLLHIIVITLVGWPVISGALAAGWSHPAAVAMMSLATVLTTYPLGYFVFHLVEKTGIEVGKRLSAERVFKTV